jgi:hypothetical protein
MLGNDLPVHDIAEHCLDMFGLAVLVVEAKTVLPDNDVEIGWPTKPANP